MDPDPDRDFNLSPDRFGRFIVWFRKAFPFLFLTFSLIFALLYYSFPLIVVRSESVRHILDENAVRLTGGRLDFEQFSFSWFPLVMPEIRQVTFTPEGAQSPLIKAERLRFRLSFPDFITGHYRISHFELSGGETGTQLGSDSPVRRMDIQKVKLKTGGIHPGKPIQVRIEGDLENVAKSFSGKFAVTLSQFEKWDWASSALEGDFKIRDFPLEKLDYQFPPSTGFNVKKGMLGGSYHFRKEARDSWLEFSGKNDLTAFVYEMRQGTTAAVSPQIEASLEFLLAWNQDAGQLILKRSALTSPLGKAELAGQFNLRTGILHEVRLTASGLSLDSIPQYYLPFKEAIPFNIGFSGKSDIEMSLEGKVDDLTLHGNWDLTSALIAYGGVFSKPKDVPFNFVLDFNIKDQAKVTGDFSMQLQNASMKGSLPGLNLKTGAGQVNIITNKFNLSGWQNFIPPLKGYVLDGDFKFLANLTGNFFRKPDEIQSMLNISLQNGTFVQEGEGGKGLRHVDLALDYGAVAFEVKQARFEIGQSPVTFEAAVYNLFQDPAAKFQIASPRLDLLEVIRILEETGANFLPEKFLQDLERAKEGLSMLLPEGEILEDLAAEIEAKDKEYRLRDLKFRAFDGQGKFKGRFTPFGDKPGYGLEGELDKISLARYFSKTGREDKVMSGNLFLSLNLTGEGFDADWKKNLKGQGVFSVTNGEFYGMDLLRVASKIHGFSSLSSFSTSETAFDDLHSGFTVAEGKMMTDQLVLFSRDLSLMGDGEVSLEGVVNYRLNLYLSMPLVGGILGVMRPEADKKFGPIPLLIAGRLENPDILPDPNLLPKLQENLAKKKSQKVFRSFLPEDFLFERPTST